MSGVLVMRFSILMRFQMSFMTKPMSFMTKRTTI